MGPEELRALKQLYPHILGARGKSAVGEDIDELADKWQAERQAADALVECVDMDYDASGPSFQEAVAAYRKVRDGK